MKENRITLKFEKIIELSKKWNNKNNERKRISFNNNIIMNNKIIIKNEELFKWILIKWINNNL